MGIPHFLAIPYPILGHMNPLLQFSQVLAKYGCKITFLSSDENYNRLKAASAGQGKLMESQIKLVSLPDGVDPQDDRSDQTKVILSTITTMRAKLPKLIQDINAVDSDNKVTCIIVTKNMGWALEVGHELGIKGALFWPASATSLASFNSMQRLIDEGIIDSENGLPRKQEIQLSSNLPMMEAAAMPWYCLDNSFFFQHMMQEMQNLNLGEWWLCNTTFDLEAGAFSTSPKLLPIGPLMMACDHNISSFLQEDRTCLEWLDLQPPQSVIYVSFGSMVSMKPNQFKELALGLDLLGKPFLWVVRTDNGKEVNNAYPDEFKGSQGKVVSWAPQKKILSHPALACFISHCGWNSTIEGVYNGVPFLCWPFCSDQLMNKAYICDVWKVGLGFDKAENGLISRGEIKKKVEQLLEDEEIKGRSLKLMEMVIKNKAEGDANLNKFINWAKE
ncbi:UDP-glycosyltransferase 83A1-like [Gastrolobium bilobum]|uniref:UDP-glycosyltransferase 83A1-like n=1 Tax=Gastrolobium bilobum TaxID=150636 RepID=UPI002AB02730|nr:UDP-glycosyltransferase 83A1-like [Gastrolobium bilobum]